MLRPTVTHRPTQSCTAYAATLNLPTKPVAFHTCFVTQSPTAHLAFAHALASPPSHSTEAASLGDAGLLQARVAAADERGSAADNDPPGAPRALRAVQGCDGQSVRLLDADHCCA